MTISQYREMPVYAVIVGNIGYVYTGVELKEALKTYAEYVRQSSENYGRAAGEDVMLTKDGTPEKEFYGSRSKQQID